MESSQHVHLSRLDHLRGFAVCLVVLWHTLPISIDAPYSLVPDLFVWSLFHEGHTGVALFLVLSGFIFTALCDGKRILYGPFIQNRLLRVAPLLTVWTLYYVYMLGLPIERVLASVASMVNVNGSFPGIGWTVLIEFQLYFLFPFLLAFSRTRGSRYLLGLIVTFIAFRTLVFLRHGYVHNLSYSTVFGRIDQFLFGMLAYQLYAKNPKWLGYPLSPLVALLAWMGVIHGYDALGGHMSPRFPSVWVFWPTLEGLFYGLITATYLRARFEIPRLLDRALVWPGVLSYSIYLNHSVILDTVWAEAIKRGVQPTSANVAAFMLGIALPAILVMSMLTYNTIERPFLAMRRRYLVPIPEPAQAEAMTSAGLAFAKDRDALG